MKRRIWSWLLVLALFFGSLPAIHAEEADVPKVPTEEIERVTEEAPKESAEMIGDIPDEEGYPVIGEVTSTTDLLYYLNQAFGECRNTFAIRYRGSDVVQILRFLANDDNIFRRKNYNSWLPIIWEYNHVWDSQGFLFLFRVVAYKHSSEGEAELNRMVDDVLSNLIDREMTEEEKIRQIDRYLTLTKYVSEEASPIWLMKSGKGGVVSYAMLAYKMLKEAGLEVCMVRSEIGNVWVKVKVDGAWYNYSSYYNEVEPENPNSRMRKLYAFLLSDEAWERKFFPPVPGVNYPAATSTKYDSENDGVRIVVSEVELQEALLKGREMYLERQFRERGFIKARGSDYDGARRSFTVTFNQDLGDIVVWEKATVYRINKNGVLDKMITGRDIRGNKIILKHHAINFPTGIYYVIVEEGIVAESGVKSTKTYYRKFYVRER